MDFDIEKIVKEIYFGFDLKNLFLRIDIFKNAINLFDKDKKILIQFISPKNIKIEVFKNLNNEIKAAVNGNIIDSINIDKIIEIGISFETLGFSEREVVQFYTEIYEKENVLERIPLAGLITFEVPDEEFEIKFWNV